MENVWKPGKVPWKCRWFGHRHPTRTMWPWQGACTRCGYVAIQPERPA